MAEEEERKNQTIDEKIREKQKRQDLQDDMKLKQDMEQEEDQLKNYFSGLNKPIEEDPTLIRKQKYKEKIATYKSVVKDLELKEMIKGIWNYRAETPEEIETVHDCKQFFKKRMYEGTAVGLGITTLTSIVNRRYLSYAAIGAGIGVGLFTGVATGFLRSTEYVLRRFEDLGPDYKLGRMAINEIEDFRLDKPRKKVI